MWITKSEYGELITEISQLKTALAGYEIRNQSAYGDLVSECMKNSGLKQKIEKLEQENEGLRNKSFGAFNSYGVLYEYEQISNALKVNEIARLKKEIEILDDKNSELEKENTKLDASRMSDLLSENHALTKKCSGLETVIQRIHEDYSVGKKAYLKEYSELKAENEKLKESIDKCQFSYRMLCEVQRGEFSKLFKQLGSVESERDALKKEIKKLTNKPKE
jgi:predicted  nucleic acid-binding Zn-ribbon protein